MTQESLARLVFLHLGQTFTGLDSRNEDTRNFNAIFDQSLKAVINKASLSDFIMPFKPQLVYNPRDEGNNYEEWYVHQYPSSLIQIESSENDFGNNEGGFRRINQAGAFDTDSSYQVVYDPVDEQKYILSRESRPMLLGSHLVSNLAYWSPQAIEAVALYMAWTLSSKVGKDESKRQSLARDLDRSISELKVYDVGNIGGNRRIPKSPFTDIIDYSYQFDPRFNRGY